MSCIVTVLAGSTIAFLEDTIYLGEDCMGGLYVLFDKKSTKLMIYCFYDAKAVVYAQNEKTSYFPTWWFYQEKRKG